MMWKWLAGIGAGLLALLKIVTMQRDSAREKAKQAKHEAEVQEAIREVENKIAQARAAQAIVREKVQNELDQSKGQRPTTSFGDRRLFDRADN